MKTTILARTLDNEPQRVLVTWRGHLVTFKKIFHLHCQASTGLYFTLSTNLNTLIDALEHLQVIHGVEQVRQSFYLQIFVTFSIPYLVINCNSFTVNKI